MEKERDLAVWLRARLDERGLTQSAAAVHAGVSPATVSDVLTKGHVPKVETLLRLARAFGADEVEVLRIAGSLQRGDELPGAPEGPFEHGEGLEWELVEAFRRVPEGWKEVAVEQVRWVVRLAERVPSGRVGEG